MLGLIVKVFDFRRHSI